MGDEAFRRGRLAFFGKIGFVFSFGFFLLFTGAELLETRDDWWRWFLTNRSNQCHLAMTGTFAALWWAAGRRRWEGSALDVLDAASLWLVGLAAVAPVFGSGPSPHRKYAMYIEITNILMVRAVIVPSSGRRTGWLGGALVPAVALAAFAFHATQPDPRPAVKATAEAAVFALLAVASSSLASAVIYGLRREVSRARRLGQYILEEKLGEGGMGIVYRARHAMLRRPTAVKLLPPERAGDAAVRRFEREVQLTSQLTHPNTVSIYDYGRTREGDFYYAMELLDGLNLEQLVAIEGPLPPARVTHLLPQLCAALAEAHDLGLVHRDVKPANVILCQRGGLSDVVKVVDFGLVKELEERLDPEDATTSLVVGTPQYMAPEAVRTPDRVGPAADLYAAGAVAFFLVTGQPLFRARTLLDVLTRQMRDAPPSPSTVLGREVPEALERLILGCLEKDPLDRPPGAAVLAESFRTVGAGLKPGWGPVEAAAWWADYRARGVAAAAITRPASSSEVATLARADSSDAGASEAETIAG